jgi:hypothetical protein
MFSALQPFLRDKFLRYGPHMFDAVVGDYPPGTR